nr:immunoglobulin heavy chain junction region [Mus musculus]
CASYAGYYDWYFDVW